MRPKVIKTDAEYRAALARLDELLGAKPGTPEGDEFELWVTLIKDYEEEQFPIDLPDPITAIRFRMEQAGMKQVDLVPYIGSPSRVSEVLKGKRSLSLSMIRKLNKGLGIPAEVLLHDPGASLPPEHAEIKWSQFPIVEMLKRGWFPNFKGTVSEAKEKAEELVAPLIFPDGLEKGSIPCFLRRSVRTDTRMDEYALSAWCARVLDLARRETLPPYRPGTVTKKFCQELVHLSYLDNGPLLAKEFLNRSGIHLIIEKHLPKTHLDGAALWASTDRPVIALTLRYDRLDNFWFTLCHELAHVSLHLKDSSKEAFVDDLEAHVVSAAEGEADAFAADVLIPKTEWEKSGLQNKWSSYAVITFANKLRIHPAIVAGRIRKERNNYRILSQLVRRNEVRRLFMDRMNT
jgi:HTH-type transcriptional regulator/antitoxin HigA